MGHAGDFLDWVYGGQLADGDETAWCEFRRTRPRGAGRTLDRDALVLSCGFCAAVGEGFDEGAIPAVFGLG